MSSARQRSAGSEVAREAQVGDGAWTALQDHLLDLRKAVQDEIRTYPTPIAGCDQQFNYLLATRDRLAAESSGIQQALARGDCARAAEIVRSSEHIHEDIKASVAEAPA
jgi:hypothetical protein